MANEEQLSILKQGSEVWNNWRKVHPDQEIDLRRADLWQANLAGADLFGAKLTGANLREADLHGVNLNAANLSGSDLTSSHLTNSRLKAADLSKTELSFADLTGTGLKGANLTRANLYYANLTRTDLSETELQNVNFNNADLNEANFSGGYLSAAIFGSEDLSKVLNLDSIHHLGPSVLGAATIHKSKGKIPEIFMRGCGLSDTDIEYTKLSNPDLSNEEINKILYRMYDLRASQALQISPLFISYSHGDGTFVDKLEEQLNKNGVRFWRDIHDMKAGRIENQIDRAISQNRTVLLILSRNSIKSDWVEHEVRTARGLEKDMGRDVLCPVALDDSWKSSPWPKRVMEQIMEYNILDFSAWEDNVKFEGVFRKLIDGLELFYKG